MDLIISTIFVLQSMDCHPDTRHAFCFRSFYKTAYTGLSPHMAKTKTISSDALDKAASITGSAEEKERESIKST